MVGSASDHRLPVEGKDARLVPPPGDGDHAVRLGGDGGEGADGEVERVAVDAGGADVGDGGGDGLAVVVVLDGQGSAAVLGLNAEVGPPSRVNGDNVSRVRVVVAAGTGVAALVEVGGVAAGLDRATVVAAAVVVRRLRGGLGSLGGRGGLGGGGRLGGGRGLVGRGGGRGGGRALDGGSGSDLSGGGGGGSGGRSGGRRRDRGGRVAVGLPVNGGRGGAGDGRGLGGTVDRGGRDVRRGRGDLSRVGRAVRGARAQRLVSEERVAAVLEERGVVLVLAVESEVPQVVCTMSADCPRHTKALCCTYRHRSPRGSPRPRSWARHGGRWGRGRR